MYSQEAVVNNQVGLHARPATFFIQKANEFKSAIWVEKEDRRVNAKSLLGVLSLGIVKGTVVQSKNFGKDFMAGMKTLVGGEITGYTEMLNEARQIAVKRMVDEAEALGADAVVNIRYGSSAVMQGAAEVIAYGTAVRFK